MCPARLFPTFQNAFAHSYQAQSLVINTATYYQKLPDVDHDGFTRNLTVGDDDHDVGVGGEHVDKCREVRVANLRKKDDMN